MKRISAEIIADSVCNGHRITTMLLTVPQIVVKELLRHRMFSFSSSSVRAIPFKKYVEDVKENMFIPIAFQSHHTGMQGKDYLTGKKAEIARLRWIAAASEAIDQAEKLYDAGVTKQLCSRIIEPYSYASILVTATEWDNFFKLRCPRYTSDKEEAFYSKKDFIKVKDNVEELFHYPCSELGWLNINKSQAEIHIQALAEAMWDKRNESVPKELKKGEYHIPFEGNLTEAWLSPREGMWMPISEAAIINPEIIPELKIKISVARCARLSYMNHDEEIDYDKDIQLHNDLIANCHFSPLEHIARAMSHDEWRIYVKGVANMSDDGEDIMGFDDDGYGWCENYRGWISYRHLIQNNHD